MKSNFDSFLISGHPADTLLPVLVEKRCAQKFVGTGNSVIQKSASASKDADEGTCEEVTPEILNRPGADGGQGLKVVCPKWLASHEHEKAALPVTNRTAHSRGYPMPAGTGIEAQAELIGYVEPVWEDEPLIGVKTT